MRCVGGEGEVQQLGGVLGGNGWLVGVGTVKGFTLKFYVCYYDLLLEGAPSILL